MGDEVFSIVFFISFLSMVVQGRTIPWLAYKLYLSISLPPSFLARRDLDTKTEIDGKSSVFMF